MSQHDIQSFGDIGKESKHRLLSFLSDFGLDAFIIVVLIIPLAVFLSGAGEAGIVLAHRAGGALTSFVQGGEGKGKTETPQTPSQASVTGTGPGTGTNEPARQGDVTYVARAVAFVATQGGQGYMAIPL